MSAARTAESTRSLRTGFLRNAADRPDAGALLIGERTWSYGELDLTARSWAHAIVDGLGRPAERVGVLGYRSELSYAGTLAALFAGAAFVPLNPTFPVNRTRSMIELADLDAVLVEEGCLEHLWSALETIEAPLVVMPTMARTGAPGEIRMLAKADVDAIGPLSTLPPTSPDDTAYLLFTSGSTGVPKGVPVTHANVCHFLDVMSDRYRLTPDDRLTQTFDQTFDLSVFDLFMAWDNGARVCSLRPIELISPASFLRRNDLTVWFSVPSIPAIMAKKNLLVPECMPTLRWSLFCGEPLPRQLAEAWQAAAPESTVENLYGPTELTISCFAYRWDPVRSPGECVNDLVPIGRPNPGLGALVLDGERHPVADGEAGELFVCGPQTVPGYWRDPQRTAERFVEIRSDAGESVHYATGDRVICGEGGDYAYLGRTDHQIKVLGFRVELGEIESVLRSAPGVVEAIAFGWPMENGVAQSVAAFVSGNDLSTDEIVSHARQKLPDYMVPKTVVVLSELPLNANGKVDRNALQARLG